MLRKIAFLIMLFSLLPVQNALADIVLGDITDEVQVRKAKKDNIIRTNKDSLDLFIKNKSDQSLLGPFLLVIKDISNVMIEVSNADGFDADGNPYFEFLQENEILKDNKKTERREILFTNNLKEKFEFTVSVLGRIADVVKEVGPDGGVIGITEPVGDAFEGVTVSVPPGVVDGNSLFVISKSADFPSLPPGNNAEFAYEIFSTGGDTFTDDISICFTYGQNYFSPTERDSLTIYYFDEDVGYWVALESFVDNAKRQVCTYVNHLSLYTMSVIADPVLLEDWNMPDNSAGWWEPNGYVSSETLGITLDTSESDSTKALLPQEYYSTDYIQVDIMLEDPSGDPNQRVNARVDGVWGNYKHATPATYVGVDGDIYMNARIEKKEDYHNPGSILYRVVCAAGRINDSAGTDLYEFYWRFLTDDAGSEFGSPELSQYIGPDTWYTATLKKTGTVLNCEIKHRDTETVLLSESVDVTGEGIEYIYEVGENKAVGVRFPNGSGVAVGKFDNLYISKDVVPAVVSDTGRIWMDRNLGASRAAQSQDDTEAYGDLYQWGRSTDGHEKRTSGTTTVLSTTDDPGHGDFIITEQYPVDWRVPQNVNLWQGVSGTNNPCPAGFRLPTQAEWDAERYTSYTLNLVPAGVRHPVNASIGNAGIRGYYWSSTTSTINNIDSVFAWLRPEIDDFSVREDGSRRGYGLSVRCIKD